MDKAGLAGLNKADLLVQAEKFYDLAQLADETFIKQLETRIEVAEKQRDALGQICQNTIDAEKDLLDQLNGAIKSGGKLHNLNAQNYARVVKAINEQKKKQ